MSDLLSVEDSPFQKGTAVSFHFPCARDGQKAQVIEVKDRRDDPLMFPKGLVFRIQFEDDLRETWCRIDELREA